jgi:hypothetical protein
MAKEENVVDESDQHPKTPGTDTGDYSNRERHEQHEGESARLRLCASARIKPR